MHVFFLHFTSLQSARSAVERHGITALPEDCAAIHVCMYICSIEIVLICGFYYKLQFPQTRALPQIRWFPTECVVRVANISMCCVVMKPLHILTHCHDLHGKCPHFFRTLLNITFGLDMLMVDTNGREEEFEFKQPPLPWPLFCTVLSADVRKV